MKTIGILIRARHVGAGRAGRYELIRCQRNLKICTKLMTKGRGLSRSRTADTKKECKVVLKAHVWLLSAGHFPTRRFPDRNYVVRIAPDLGTEAGRRLAGFRPVDRGPSTGGQFRPIDDYSIGNPAPAARPRRARYADVPGCGSEVSPCEPVRRWLLEYDRLQTASEPDLPLYGQLSLSLHSVREIPLLWPGREGERSGE